MTGTMVESLVKVLKKTTSGEVDNLRLVPVKVKFVFADGVKLELERETKVDAYDKGKY